MSDRIAVRSLYPATVTRPDGRVLDKARVVLTRGDATEPPLLFVWVTPIDLPGEPWDPSASAVDGRDWFVVTDAGIYAVTRARGCNCGVLARWQPWEPFRVGVLT